MEILFNIIIYSIIAVISWFLTNWLVKRSTNELQKQLEDKNKIIDNQRNDFLNQFEAMHTLKQYNKQLIKKCEKLELKKRALENQIRLMKS